MAGNANSGRHKGGRSIHEMITYAARRAIKQGDLMGAERSLSGKLSQLMQDDVAKFMQVVAPYVPKEIVVDAGINLVEILALANQRTDQYLQDLAAARLSSDVTTNTQAITVDSVAIRVDESQGGVGG